MKTLRNGDIIRVNRGVYAHYGIYAETSAGPHVIHYTGETGHKDFKGVVRETSLAEFLDGSNDFSAVILDPKKYPVIYSGEKTVERARSRLNEKGYNLFAHNCEHFAVECKTGQTKSSQTELLDIGSVFKGVLSAAEELFGF